MEALMKSRGYSIQLRYVIDDDSKVGEARRAAQAAANFEFDAQVAGRVAIAATELARNLLRHAGGGELLLQVLGSDATATVELLAIDRGPGMTDVERCMRDGFSTGGTPGTGLGAVRRLADDFDIYSVPGEGTVVMARFGKGPEAKFGVVCVPLQGEAECGDGWHLVADGNRVAAIIVDGLGHGAFAAEAARAGIDAFAASPWAPPHFIMHLAGTAMARTRGGAAAAALIEGSAVSYAGVGNVAGSLVSAEKSQGLVSHAGTLGMQGMGPATRRAAQQFEYTRPAGGLLVMHSDGISARWSLKDRPALFTHHPAIVAGVLYRDHGREKDDATVLVIA
jgi:anti-sigma regulatory factor (Ser/Thr protein kinase)